MKATLCTYLLVVMCLYAQAQKDSANLLDNFSYRYANKVEHKAKQVEEGLTKQSRKALGRLYKQQQMVTASLRKLDSNAAMAYLKNAEEHYQYVLNKLQDRSTTKLNKIKTYVPGLDSATGVLSYLVKVPGIENLPGKEKIGGALIAATKAGGALDGAAEVKKLMQQQKEQIKALATHYKDLDISKQLKAYNQEIYYYSQRIHQAREVLNDPSKIEREVLKLLRRNNTFQNWMLQNGQLAQLFGAPGSTSAAQIVAGQQTRQSVQQLLQNRLGGSIQQAQQVVSNSVQQAQAQLSNARSRLQQLGVGSIGNGSSDMNMPDFKPNTQKIKPFLERLEYGFNMQSQKNNRWLPSTSDIGLSLGYKLNDKSAVGVGVAYKLGWGQPISHIHFYHQGVGLRSYLDYKLKGSFWISGGYEMNYQSAFSSIDILRDYSAWQRSGLIGMNKKIKQGKRTLETKLLWDFLSYQQIPRTQHLIFRIEYKLK